MKLAAIFSDNMVLQRDKEIFIFGESEVAERIKIHIDNIQVSSEVDAGSWKVKLPSHVAGGPFDMTVSAEPVSNSNVDSESSTIKIIRNVLYGEVWIDNGQSNMEFELINSSGGKEEIKNASYPEIRFFKAIKAPVIDDTFLEEESKLSWKTLTDEDFGEMSGVAYFYAVKLYKELGVPVGMIDCYQGGTSITCWMEREVLESSSEGKLYLNEFDKLTENQSDEDFENLLNEYNRLVDIHLELADKARTENPDITPGELEKAAGKYPWPPPKGLKSAFRPGGLIETMFKRIAPYGVRGVLYYQGEEDAVTNYNNVMKTGTNDMYRNLMVDLINQYRRLLMDDSIPFVMVQLPMYIDGFDEDIRDWAYIRDAQGQAADMADNTFMITLLDGGEYGNVHPLDKKTPGLRLAGTVLSKVYGMTDAGAEDMILESWTISDNRIILEFKNTYGEVLTMDNDLLDHRGELGAESMEESENENSEHIFGFEISSDLENWSVPRTYINGEHVVVEIKPDTTELRYGFFNYGKVNLYNAKGYTLRQFRIRINNL